MKVLETSKIRTQEPGKLFKIAVLFLFATMIVSWSRAGTGSQDQHKDDQPQSRLDVLGYQTTLQEKLGRDDGVSFIIHFAGDTHGNLDVCG